MDRTYLSIREVLDLLVGEFPDVTISKIRFLESRGLIHPERTPSGYRKFYDHDVDRLRWILRQQREHFLPLKVIKGRLENGPAPALFDTDALAGDPRPPAGPPPAEEAPSVEAHRPEAPAPEAPLPETPAAEPATTEAAVAEAAVAEAATPEAAPGGVPAPVAEAVAYPSTALGPPAGLCFSAEELSSACGAEVELVEELEEFGLLAGKTVAGVRVYDEDDLVVVRVAAGVRRFGIEARHLRIFKHAAEREASLFSQVVTPLLRQRNPSARERADQELCELTELGAQLQALFLRAVLRDLTGG